MRTKINAIINILEIIVFIPVALSSIIFYLVWPTGSGGYQGGKNLNYVADFWGWEKQQWSAFHTYLGLIFIVLMIIHIALHWRWFTCLPKLLFPAKKPVEKCDNK